MIPDATQKGYLKSIETAGKSFLQEINGILDLSKTDAGKIETQVTPIDLKKVFNEIKSIKRQGNNRRNRNG